MNAIRKLEAVKSELQTLVHKVDTAIKDQKKQKEDVELSKVEVNQVMGYRDGYVYSLDIPWGPNGTINYRDLWEWAKRNKPNRLNRMRKNIKEI